MTVQRRDYVVVGAGPGGCAAAHRLSEDPDATVLVLEAGGPDVRPEIANAMEWPLLLRSEVDWSRPSTPGVGAPWIPEIVCANTNAPAETPARRRSPCACAAPR